MVKNTRSLLFAAAFIFFGTATQAQYSKPLKHRKAEVTDAGIKSEEKTVPITGVLSFKDADSYFNPVLLRTGIYHGEKREGQTVIAPEELPPYIEDGKNASREKKAAETPTVFRSYTGYSDSKYTPPDNTVAVNNAGVVVSAMNSNLRIFRNTGIQLKYTSFFDVFKAQFPTFKASFYDPKVIYDSGSDRFILVILHGNSSDSSKIMVMFSKTSDPLDGWNLYALNGDVLGKNQWTDYPNIGISNNELYITGNLFNDNHYYEEPFILQINKMDGYDAKNLRMQAWSGMKDQSGSSSFTLVPVPYGQQGNYGPGTYFVSNNQHNSSNVNLFDLTNDMSASDEKLERSILQNPFSYSVPHYSSQKGSEDLLNAGDTRIKHAFFLDNTIHYVYTTLNSNNNSSIVYCRINVESMTQDFRSLGQAGSNYNYPSIASLGSDDKDKSVLIGFLRSGANIYPEMRAVHCDDNFEFSTSLLVQAGLTSVNVLSDKVERWGDYTGMARKYSTNGVLFSGSYGSGSRWTTRIAEIGLQSNKTSVAENVKSEESNTQVYPNPVINEFTVTFNLETRSHVTIQLYDMQGRIVETLQSGTERAGQKLFSFNSAALTSGIYTLYIRSGENALVTKKVVVK